MESSKLRTTILLSTFFLTIRAASFFWGSNLFTEIITGAIVTIFAMIAYKHHHSAWLILITEIMLNGAGLYTEFASLLLRTWFLGILGITWIFHTVTTKTIPQLRSREVTYSLIAFAFVLCVAIIRGIYFDHNTTFVLQDAILYGFIFLLIPFSNIQLPQIQKLTPIVTSYITATTLFTYTTFVLYSSHILTLRDEYYHWFRNVASGKITDLGFNFYRVVLSEHLFIVPIILVAFARLVKSRTDAFAWFLMTSGLLVMVTNFTRIYIVALVVGSLFVITRNQITTWIKTGIIVSALAATLFLGTHAIASRGASLGLELIGLRAYGVIKPETDLSSAIRQALLPDIYATISRHPFIGSGLGTPVSHTDPITHEQLTRTQFDWGYFEMIAELGIVGSLIYLTLISFILREFIKKTQTTPVTRGLFAGAIALFVINITTPALFQGFGVLYFVFLYTITPHLRSHTIDDVQL